MALSDVYERFTQLFDEEDRFNLEACELAEHALFDMVYKSEQEPDSVTVKEFLVAVHTINLRLQVELLELRKGRCALHVKSKCSRAPLRLPETITEMGSKQNRHLNL
ncbi:hypothetical protein [Paenibacillus sp. Cedars]|uniref:hypothetical protein n=1 Tax=Paenibacillus sp. Cedars TaxID=1980674 RepID=UPI00116443C5|nr:hypothetical protein [Paenibacillus sp. Cedars]AWP30395.1 hypothetical protein B9D94_29000 [Paenibacillus sp. Cedars]